MENSSSEENVVCSREDVINALFEFFIDPLMVKTPTRGRPALSSSYEKDIQIAKQMHAVVLLYKYYYSKQYPESEYIGFEELCNHAVALRPSLKMHMKFTNIKSSSDDNIKSVALSETEKAIHNAINISLVLDPVKDKPNVEDWPVSKVAVHLVDSVKQTCIVLESPMTKFVYSIIEKDVGDECKGKWKNVYKKRGSKKKTHDDVDPNRFQKIAFAAVKKETGVTEADLKVLESHLVYSLNKEKTCTRFYIVQYTGSSYDIPFPLQDLIDGMRGPVVKESSGKITATSVVQYYHVLPYAAIMSDWLSRQEIKSNNSQGVREMSIENKELASEEEEVKVGVSKPLSTNDVQMSEAKDGEFERILTDKHSEHQKRKSMSAEIHIDARTTSVEASESKMKQTLHEGEHKNEVPATDKNYDTHHRKLNTRSSSLLPEVPAADKQEMQSNNPQGVEEMTIENKELASEEEDKVGESKLVSTDAIQMAETKEPNHENDGETERILTDIKARTTSAEKRKNHSAEKDIEARTTSAEKRKSHSAEKDVEARTNSAEAAESKMKQTLHVSKHKKDAKKLQKTASAALIKKRKELADLLASLQDEEAVYDQKIKIISDGGERGTAVALEVVIDHCKEDQDRNDSLSQDPIPNTSCNANLSSEIPCQELDEIAKENNCRLPKYVVQVSNGMFSAKVKFKVSDIKLSAEGDLKSLPKDARASAAEKLLAKLHHLKVKEKA